MSNEFDPFAEELTELRAAQRRLLRLLPTKLFDVARLPRIEFAMETEDRPLVELWLRSEARREQEGLAPLISQLEDDVTNEAAHFFFKRIADKTSYVIGGYFGDVTSRLRASFDEAGSRNAASEDEANAFRRMVTWLVWADELAPDTYEDSRIAALRSFDPPSPLG